MSASHFSSLQPPPLLPQYWITKRCTSNRSHFYYYNAATGESTWTMPVASPLIDEDELRGAVNAITAASTPKSAKSGKLSPSSDKKRKHDAAKPSSSKSEKKSKSSSSSSAAAAATGKPKKVRVMHILKKHADSSRPSSWREKVITKTLADAIRELTTLKDMILEVSDDGANGEELRSTFEAVATDESDCSSAKRGGDLGFFEHGKMKKAFWEASTGLKVGEMGRVLVETSSGVHLLYRIG